MRGEPFHRTAPPRVTPWGTIETVVFPRRSNTVAGPNVRGTNPGASTVIVYTFDASSGARKLPFGDVTKVRTRPEGSANDTTAPATASEASRTPSPFTSRQTSPGYEARNVSGRSSVVDPVNDLRSWYAFGPDVAWTSYVPRGIHAMYTPKLLVLVT